MTLAIEQYALIGDMQSAALVGSDGSIDWLCLPRFDSDACFAAVLGGHEHGCWVLAPEPPVKHVERRYRDGTLVLDTVFETDDGAVRVTDFMPPRGAEPDLVRVAEGLRGRVAERNTFVQSYGSRELDASLLMIPLVGFLPPGDARVRGTVEAVQRELGEEVGPWR